MSGGSTTWSSTLTRMRSFMSMVGLPRIAWFRRAYARWPRAPHRPLRCPHSRTPVCSPRDARSLRSLCALRPAPRPAPTAYRTVANTGDAGQRDVVFGGQFLAQAIVAASLRHPGKDVRSIQAVFARPGRIDAPTELVIDPMHDGRTFASDTVTAWQGDRLCARFIVLLDADEPDVVRHDVAMPTVPGPVDAAPDRAGWPRVPGRRRSASSTTSTSGTSTRPSARPRRSSGPRRRRCPTSRRCIGRRSPGPPTGS